MKKRLISVILLLITLSVLFLPSCKKETEPDYETVTAEQTLYVWSRDSDKYHLSTCSYVNQIKEENRMESTDKAIASEGREACKTCKP